MALARFARAITDGNMKQEDLRPRLVPQVCQTRGEFPSAIRYL